MHITILGAGNVGAALGKGWARAGHTIAYGVPNPGDPKHSAAAEAAHGAVVLSVAEAAAAGEVIVLAIPWQAVEQAIGDCGDLSGRIVLDATNPLAMGANGLGLEIGFSVSGGEQVAALAKGAKVVKTMNQVGFAVMAATEGYPTRPAMFVAGDDAQAKAVCLALVGDLGFDPLDAGPLRNSRLLEAYAMLWIDQAMYRGAPITNAFAFMRREA